MAEKVHPGRYHVTYKFEPAYRGCTILVRVQDTYRAYNSDAIRLARLLALELSSEVLRGRGRPSPMVWIPRAEAERYLQKMVECGLKVAVFDRPMAAHPKPRILGHGYEVGDHVQVFDDTLCGQTEGWVVAIGDPVQCQWDYFVRTADDQTIGYNAENLRLWSGSNGRVPD
ncbi:MAG: hypothetical protein KJ077_10705 [Anaerolineae bacterium]|nr:hypothetical protein [Anaerolineae bacterium]